MSRISISNISDSNFTHYDFRESSGLWGNVDPGSGGRRHLHLPESHPSRRGQHDLHQRDGPRRVQPEEASLTTWWRSLFLRRPGGDRSGEMPHLLSPRNNKVFKMARSSPFCPCFSGEVSDSDDDDFRENGHLVYTVHLLRAPDQARQPFLVPPGTNNDRRLSNPVHRIIEFTHHLIPEVDKIYAASYYWGPMDRFKAESLLAGKPEGTFLLRDSAQSEYLFSVSFRRYQRILHARIEQGRNLFSFDILDEAVFSAPSVTQLIENYKDPAKCLFFEPLLSNPLPRNTVFSLQDLCRAAIASRTTYSNVSQLPLPAKQKNNIRDLHYSVPIRTLLTSND